VYGRYYCRNVVASRGGVAGAVLVRGAEPVAGVGDDPRALAGPGKLARALGLTTAQTNMDLVRSELSLRDAPPVPSSRVARAARIGLNQHATTHEPWRLYIRDSPGVSRPSTKAPLPDSSFRRSRPERALRDPRRSSPARSRARWDRQGTSWTARVAGSARSAATCVRLRRASSSGSMASFAPPILRGCFRTRS